MKAKLHPGTIGDYCEVIAGQSPEGKHYNTEKNGVPFYQGKKDFGDKFIRPPTTWTVEITKTARKGDILMSVRAPVGPINFATENICIGRGLAALRSKGLLNIDFLFYQLLHLQPLIAGKEGAVFASINKAEIAALPIVVAALPEQQRIVTLLDAAFAGIATAQAHAEKNLQNARAIFESHLQSVFSQRGDGWAEKRLADVTSIINGFAFKSGDFSPHAKVQSIKITNVGVREFVCESDSLLPTDFLEKYASFSIRAGSIVIALTRTIIADGLKVAVVPDEFDGALLNQRVAAILVNSDVVNAEFLFAYLSSQFVFDYVKAHVNTLMQPNLSINDLRAMLIPSPPTIQQEQIAARLKVLKDETQRLESLYQSKLAALAELRKSLLYQAFSGQL